MKLTRPRSRLKDLIGMIPGSAKLYQSLRPEIVPPGGYDLERILRELPRWKEALERIPAWTTFEERRRLMILGNLKWWLEYGITLGMFLQSAGHDVDLAYLPYRDWTQQIPRFDAVRAAHYVEKHLKESGLPLGLRSLLTGSSDPLPAELDEEIKAQAFLDVQYTLQREDIDFDKDLQAAAIYQLRLKRNRQAAGAALKLIRAARYDALLIPNGSILEFGALYRVGRALGVPVVTFEFGEQRERVWLSQDNEVMRLDTTHLWQVTRDIPLSPDERARLDRLFEARRGGMTWSRFKRRWQAGLGEGAERARQMLGLDADRPVVLLCTNVVGDSLALNRQIFTAGMADWLSRTVEYFANRLECQLVVRVHPGEMLGAGHPSVEIVRSALPSQPGHVNVVPPESEINTYDLIELAHLGLVYTTTVGLELCMHGVPVVVAGATHYRGKGFTEDPNTWDEYLKMVAARLEEPQGRSLTQGEIDKAWRYAYRFFFDFPFPFPWHLISFWEDLAHHPWNEVLEANNLNEYKATLDAFSGQPIDWAAKAGIPLRAEVEIAR